MPNNKSPEQLNMEYYLTNLQLQIDVFEHQRRLKAPVLTEFDKDLLKKIKTLKQEMDAGVQRAQLDGVQAGIELTYALMNIRETGQIGARDTQAVSRAEEKCKSLSNVHLKKSLLAALRITAAMVGAALLVAALCTPLGHALALAATVVTIANIALTRSHDSKMSWGKWAAVLLIPFAASYNVIKDAVSDIKEMSAQTRLKNAMSELKELQAPAIEEQAKESKIPGAPGASAV